MRAFRGLVALRIIGNVALGLLLFARPEAPFEWLHEATPQSLWLVRIIGVGLVYLSLAHVGSLIAPALAMSSNLFVVVGPIVPIALLVWIGIEANSRAAFLLAFYESVFVLLLASSLQRGWLRELATKP